MSPATAAPPALPMTPRRAVERREDECRVCGVAIDLGVPFYEGDLCAECHGPRRPTRRQAGELGRIRSRWGPLTIRASPLPGCLEVVLIGSPEDREHRAQHQLSTLCLIVNSRGRVVGRQQVRA